MPILPWEGYLLHRFITWGVSVINCNPGRGIWNLIWREVLNYEMFTFRRMNYASDAPSENRFKSWQATQQGSSGSDCEAEAWGIYSLPRCLLNFSSGEPYNFGRAERRWRRRGHVNCLAQALVESSGATHGVTSFKKTCLHHCQMIQPFNRCNISC